MAVRQNGVKLRLNGPWQMMRNNFTSAKKSFQRNEGDVGMSRHKKQGRKEDAYTKTEGDTQLHPYILEYAT